MQAAAFIRNGEPADVMLLDIRMPGKSGLDVVEEAISPPPFPIIAMTGDVDVETQEHFK